MYVCMFAMDSVPVKASVTKLSMAPPQAQRMVIGGYPPSPEGVGVGVKFHPGYDATKFCKQYSFVQRQVKTRS